MEGHRPPRRAGIRIEVDNRAGARWDVSWDLVGAMILMAIVVLVLVRFAVFHG